LELEIRSLLEAGVHFGHQTRRWNPKMKPFIFTARNGIYIIDLQKTLKSLKVACQKAREVAAEGKPILFVGTKMQAKNVIKDEAQRSDQFYVTERWLGGMMTNFQTIRQSIKRLHDLEQMCEDGTLEKLTKKERLKVEREVSKLNNVLGGIKDMNRLPGLVFLADSRKEKIAVAEAVKLGIPTIAIVDTNANPDPINFPVAGNDDAIKSIRVLTHAVADAVIEGQAMKKEEKPPDTKKPMPARPVAPDDNN
jgi:small subunit ribosomal protein S2